MMLFTELEREAYRRDGYVVARAGRLLSAEAIEAMRARQRELAEDAECHSGYFSMVERGVLFESRPFRSVALHSELPRAAAELMGMTDCGRENLRVLRDVLLAKDIDEAGCNWHVDDQSFWPESFLNADERNNESINVWIALDDMPAEYRGSMALAPGSHEWSWRHEAYRALGQNRDENGGKTWDEWTHHFHTLKREGKSPFGTCSLHMSQPDMTQKFEECRKVIDLKRGDIIFATRSLFHKTDDVTEPGKEYFRNRGIQTLARYSLRYCPGTSRLPNGWVAEWSCMMDDSAPGRSLDEIPNAWYPRVWPTCEADIDDRLDALVSDELPKAKKKMKEESARFFALTK